jgi:conjugative relaxase-like TrwC/TraI family protein
MIHPRRLKGTPANLARYYTVGDYYTKSADEHSEWGGRIAGELGLDGRVNPETFKALLSGKVGEQQLGRHRSDGKMEHHPGWDFAVNAPKSVSIVALVAGDDRILSAHEQAVTVALSYLEEHATLRRRSDGGILHETTGRLIFARFTEHASRELDPHLHTHVVVMNITNRGDGEPMASLETRAMFAEQMVAGQIYRNELAHRLRELGYEVETDPRRGLFEISDVPKDLIRQMSQRAEQIEAHAREHGLTGQAARRISFYETRGPKEKASVDTLRETWLGRLGDHREAVETVRSDALARGERTVAPEPATSARAMLFGIRQEEGREAVNNLGHLLGRALASHVGEVRLSDVRPLAQTHEAARKLLETRHETGDNILTRGRATRRSARLEIALSDHLALAISDAPLIAQPDRLREIASAAGLTSAQETALLHLGTSDNRIVGLHGVAGAGKSTLISALNEAAPDGMTLIAVAPTSSAAGNLGATAGIEARTVASLLAGGGRGLNETHVIIVDEAGQLATRQALRILELSRKSGARLIFLGDNRQTGAIEQGKPFWLLQRLGMSKAELTESVRQETRSMKAAVTQARLGNYSQSLANLDKIVSGEGADELAGRLVEEWTRLKPESRESTNILVLENATRVIINTKIREVLKTEGGLAAEDARLSILVPSGMSEQEKRFARFYSGGQVVIFSRDNARSGIARDMEYRVAGVERDERGRQWVQLVDQQGRVVRWDPRLGRTVQVNIFKEEERQLAIGDRVQWRLVNRELDLRNADRGTIQELADGVATVRWDRDGKAREIDLIRHKTWDHGYAETVYSAQSKTYDRVYVLAPVNSPLVTGQGYYTAITRARFGAKLWTEDEKRLVDKLDRRSGEKTSALEGLGRLGRESVKARGGRHAQRLEGLRAAQLTDREERRAGRTTARHSLGGIEALVQPLASRAQLGAATIDRWLRGLAEGAPEHDVRATKENGPRVANPASRDTASDRGDGHDR